MRNLDPFAPVRKERLYTADKTPSNQFAVFVKDVELKQEMEVGTVSDTYQLVANEDVYQTGLDVLTRSEQDFEPSITRFDGKKYRQRWVLPNLNIEPRKGDIVQLAVDVINSYDGSTTFGLSFAARRLVCLNGMQIDYRLGSYKFRHHNRPEYQQELAEAANHVGKLVKHLEPLKDKISELISTPVDRTYIQGMFNELKLGQGLVGQIYMNLEEDTQWGLYNACTSVLTERGAHSDDNLNRRISKIFI